MTSRIPSSGKNENDGSLSKVPGQSESGTSTSPEAFNKPTPITATLAVGNANTTAPSAAASNMQQSRVQQNQSAVLPAASSTTARTPAQQTGPQAPDPLRSNASSTNAAATTPAQSTSKAVTVENDLSSSCPVFPERLPPEQRQEKEKKPSRLSKLKGGLEERRNNSNSDVERQAPPPPGIPGRAPPKRSTKLRQLLLVIIALSVTGPLAIFSFYYLYEALVSDNPRLGRLFLSPSRTLNLVSILTHSLATLLPIIIIQLFDIIRWQLLWRDNGILAPKFLALSGATSWWGLVTLGRMCGTHLLWTWQRYI